MECPNDKPNSPTSPSPPSKPTPHQPDFPEPDLIKQFTINDNSDKLPPLPMMPGSGNQELNISTMTGDIEEALKNLEMDISDKKSEKVDNYVVKREMGVKDMGNASLY